MRIDPFVLAVFISLTTASSARANSTCTSVLTADQLHELTLTIFPSHPFSAHLTEAVDGDRAQGAVRRFTLTEIEKLRGAIAHPFMGPTGNVRPEQDAALKAWLKSNPSAELPAWDASASESDVASEWVPRAWIGRRSDDFLHLLQEPGNAGPLGSATLSDPTTRGQILGITHHVATDASGRDTYIWSYVYRVTVGGRRLTTLLAICQADVVTMSDDEAELRALEQQIARAWPTRDRSTIERIVAREWSVTMPDGTSVSRAALIRATFDSPARIVERMTTDDDQVTVTLFGTAAVVRGRSLATVVVSGARRTNSVRFTDVFIKRMGTWQVVASHLSNTPQ